MCLREKIRAKAAGRRGESLIETLAALLIASLALVMLAAMLNASAHSIRESRKKMAEYYEANNAVSLSSSEQHGSAVIRPVTGGSSPDSIDIIYSVNDTVSSYKVISFKKK